MKHIFCSLVVNYEDLMHHKVGKRQQKGDSVAVFERLRTGRGELLRWKASDCVPFLDLFFPIPYFLSFILSLFFSASHGGYTTSAGTGTQLPWEQTKWLIREQDAWRVNHRCKFNYLSLYCFFLVRHHVNRIVTTRVKVVFGLGNEEWCMCYSQYSSSAECLDTIPLECVRSLWTTPLVLCLPHLCSRSGSGFDIHTWTKFYL